MWGGAGAGRGRGGKKEREGGGREGGREWGTPRTAALDLRVNLGKTRVGEGGEG